MTPAHHTNGFGELVCSNSLKGAGLDNAAGLLKEEMRRLDSLLMKVADKHAVPAGGALAVDRDKFSHEITATLENHPLIRVHREEVKEIPQEDISVIATGPLTSDNLAQEIQKLTGEDALAFYDAAAPIVALETIDLDKAFWASRYDKGDPDYLNCPMTEEEYKVFYEELCKAETADVKGFEKGKVFEGCMPIEVMAARGEKTLTFGPLKPVGLVDPRTGKRSHAVVQLRKENKEGTLMNLVGFQTHLKWGEQKRVFRLIPGLENAEFLRFGVMHRNTFLNAPKVLNGDFSLKRNPNLFFAGQITGVEGYVESIASGLVAGINGVRRLQNKQTLIFPEVTALGALARHLEGSPSVDFQPMSINYGLIPPLGVKIKAKKEKNLRISERSLAKLEEFSREVGLI